MTFHIIVCIKQVPETGEVEIDPQTGTLKREGVSVEVNPFDLNAIEEAVRIKEKFGGYVTVLSMGPPQAETAVRDCLALGCDRGILLTDNLFAGADTWATANTLAHAIRKIRTYDLILCGMKSTDGDTAQVGPELAEKLGLPSITYANKIQRLTENDIKVEKLIEDGYEIIKAPLPCLLTVTKGINEPRLPSFKAKLQAKKASITLWSSNDLAGDKTQYGLSGSPTQVVKVFYPEPSQTGEWIEGSAREQAKKISQKLRKLKLI